MRLARRFPRSVRRRRRWTPRRDFPRVERARALDRDRLSSIAALAPPRRVRERGAARGDAAERITSTDNATVKHFAKLVKDRAHRERSGSVVVAGAGLLEEICGASAASTASRVEAKTLILADDAEAPRGVVAGRVLRAPERVLKKAAGLRSADRVEAVAELAVPDLSRGLSHALTVRTASHSRPRRVLALDGIQDPGNLGTLVRTALALGWDAAALLPGTCDPFNDKALPFDSPSLARLEPAREPRVSLVFYR